MRIFGRKRDIVLMNSNFAAREKQIAFCFRQAGQFTKKLAAFSANLGI
jgi:hypothetical protein